MGDIFRSNQMLIFMSARYNIPTVFLMRIQCRVCIFIFHVLLNLAAIDRLDTSVGFKNMNLANISANRQNFHSD